MGSSVAARPRVPFALAAVAVAVAMAGCATAPSGGPPRKATGGSNEVQAYVQPLPPPGPTSAAKWQPTAVVWGFLHASASYAFDPAAARQYLAPALRKTWQPDHGPVAVVGGPTAVTEVQSQPQIPALGPQSKTVRFTGQRLATLSQSGQYEYNPGPKGFQYEFVLAKIDGVWLIQQLPAGQLLLTQSDFEEVYQPRNLFFLAPLTQSRPSGVLVPDPVYAPLQSSNSALNTNLATQLVRGLLAGQSGWLSGSTQSAFPRGTSLIKPVTITGRTAQVDLGGPAARAPRSAIQLMAAQLLATLRDNSYSLPLASQLLLDIDNAPAFISTSSAQPDLVPELAPGPLYVMTGSGGVGELPGVPKPIVNPPLKLDPAQVGGATITAVAASPAAGPPELAVALRAGRGCEIYLKPGSQSYPLSQTGGPCTSLSWDSNGNLWVAAGQSVWVLRSASRQPIAVDLSAIPAVREPGASVLALRMAPDAVRVALLIRTPGSGNRLLIAAVHLDQDTASIGQAVAVGNPAPASAQGGEVGGLADPIAVGWSDAYHLAVLASDEIFDVPLTDAAGQLPVGLPAPEGAATLTTDGSEVVVGTAATRTGPGRVFVTSVAAPRWIYVTKGNNPTYPG